MVKNKYPISFIIPCYNCEKTIEESVSSIVDLKLSNYEICMVDDCSNDRTLEIIKNLSRKYSNLIKIMHHQKNMGGAVTRNDCVSLSKFNWVFCLDSDNVLHKESVLKLINEIDLDNDFISFGLIKFFFDFLFLDIKLKEWFFKAKEMSFDDLRKTNNNPVASGNLLFSKRMFDKIGGYETDLGAYDSYAFGYKALYYGFNIKIVKNSWYYHRLSLNSYWEREISKNVINFRKLLLRFPEKFTKEEIYLIKNSDNVYPVFLNLKNDFTFVRENLLARIIHFCKSHILI